MIIGVPKEIKDHESRVGLVPAGVTTLREHGHEVLVESGAGRLSSIHDFEYEEAGARVLASAADVWAKADLVVKVKEPATSTRTTSARSAASWAWPAAWAASCCRSCSAR